ncbi:MAG: hypothetical protein GMKNLPBB_01853 [Myxococcota bacterium]|nr:hypothetical protein [Myxococcota bacterium]
MENPLIRPPWFRRASEWAAGSWSRARRAALLLAVFLLGGVTFTAGGILASGKSAPYAKLDIFARVLSLIENNYVEQVDSERVIHGAIRGMMGELDQHSTWMSPGEYSLLKQDTSGELTGIGVETAIRDGVLTVLSPVPDSPAARAGILGGDQILEIDGVKTLGLDLGGASERLRGPVGTRVELLVLTPPNKRRKVMLIREQIRTVSVTHRLLKKGIGYVRIKNFQDRTWHYMRTALEEMKRESGGRLRGLIMDLRNNPGGLLDQGIKVADEFLTDGLIVSTEGRGKRQIERNHAHPVGTEEDYPLVVLVNEGSASASEIVAGALQDQDRAVLVGVNTYGKGSVQTIMELDDGSGLKLTIARYYTPKGKPITEDGIPPDVNVPAKDTQAASPQREWESSPLDKWLAEDPQMKAGLGILEGWSDFVKDNPRFSGLGKKKEKSRTSPAD